MLLSLEGAALGLASGLLRQALGSRIGEAYHAWKKALAEPHVP